jgi:hypothetical protein
MEINLIKQTKTTGSCETKKVIEIPQPVNCQPLLNVLKKDVFVKCQSK